MATLFDYLEWRGDLEFSAVPPNEVDSLIFSQIAYIGFDGIVPESKTDKGITLLSAMKRYLKERKDGQKTKIGVFLSDEVVKLATYAARSRRFGSLYMNGFINRVCEIDQTQFCAMTFNLGNGERFIVFRGTDDTLIGWKESFNMSFMLPIPSQLQALEYVKECAAVKDGDFYIGGHSKGGNLAVFSAVELEPETRVRVKAVYNNDGPGFTREFIENEKYIKTRKLIQTFVPQSSIVGMLLEHEESYVVVKSTQNGIFQHNGLSWEVMGGELIHLDTVTKESRRIDIDLKRWLSTMTADERKRFLDTIYEILVSTNAKTLTDLNSDKLKLVKAWNSLDDESKVLIKRCAKALIQGTKDKDAPDASDASQKKALPSAQPQKQKSAAKSAPKSAKKPSRSESAARTVKPVPLSAVKNPYSSNITKPHRRGDCPSRNKK